jgi:hypothetical protein
MLKLVLLGGVSAIAALLMRRRHRRDATLDVGAVSEEWVANRRGINDALS